MVLKLVRVILELYTMEATDSVFMKILTGNPGQETAKITSSSYFSNKYFDG